jgi:anti-sigma regulatory factor (Ser/Thr protein kinase)
VQHLTGTSAGRAPLTVPGLEITVAGGTPAGVAAHRAGTNRWVASIGPGAHAADALAERDGPAMPSDILHRCNGQTSGDLVQLSVELDVCGAWITVANAGRCRPVAVRRAGWVDLRGHPTPALGSTDTGTAQGYADDRVGLGPGDALAMIPAQLRPDGSAGPSAGGHVDGDDRLLDLLLAHEATGSALSADRLAAAFGHPADLATPVAVIRVPDPLGPDRHGELAAALGVPRGELQLPGYPLGDLQPDLWAQPPTPPRSARIHLPPDLAKALEVRTLLGRLLGSWRIADRVAADDVALLTSEVVTNAVRHSGTDAAVTVRYTGPTVEVSVRDGCRLLPSVLPPDPWRTGGRGMVLVDALSAAWGTISTPDGKVVWFEVPVAAGTST